MPSPDAVFKTSTVYFSVALLISVVMVKTSSPSLLIASMAIGKSLFTFSGLTWPLGRTVRSMPSKPIFATSFAMSLKLSQCRFFENMLILSLLFILEWKTPLSVPAMAGSPDKPMGNPAAAIAEYLIKSLREMFVFICESV
ncbi:hypothetical protein D3C87_1386850 [compost metagenome]